MKVGDFKKGIMEEFDICYLEGNRKKNGMYFQTFFNSETVRIIELYLKERKDVSNESWLFANKKANTKGVYTKCKHNTFSESLKKVRVKLDIKNITPKSLRRYFNTTMKRNKIDFEIRERLLGHKVEISKGSAYDEILNDDYKLAKFYSDKVEVLTLLGNGNRKLNDVDKKIEELESEKNILIKDLSNTNEKLELLLSIMNPKKQIRDLEYKIKQIETTEEGKQNAIKELELNLPNGSILHEGDLELFIEDLKEDLDKYKKLAKL